MPTNKILENLIRTALAEDLGSGDITNLALLEPDQKGHARIKAKQAGILSGIDTAIAVFQIMDSALTLKPWKREGDVLRSGDVILSLEGRLVSILSAERTALNFLAHLSGIATETARYVKELRNLHTRVTDTRKTTPGLRMLEKGAVKAGGGVNHRMGLYDMILIKENHIEAAGSIQAAVKKSDLYRRSHGSGVKIEAETTNLDQVKEALDAGVDRIMLDNMSPAMVGKAVALVAGAAETEASGGITLANIRIYAETGVDYISVGALTHSAPAFDFTLLLGNP